MSIDSRLFTGALIGLLAIVVLGASFFFYTESRQHHLVLAAGSSRGEAFDLAEAIAEVTHNYNPQYFIEVVETAGSLENMRLLEAGQVDLATVQADMPVVPSANLIALTYPDVFQLVVRKDSGIESVADLKGHRLALPPESSGQSASFRYLARHYRLRESDVWAVPMTARSANWALRVGAVDAVFRVRAPGNASIRELIEGADTRIIAIDQVAAMHLGQPAISEGTIPKGSYRGNPPLPEQDIATAEVQRLLLAHEDLDNEAVKTITSALFEHRRDLVALTPLAGFISTPDLSRGTFVPIHPGAQQFFDREKPSFFSEHAELLGLVVTLSVLFGTGLLGARRRWEGVRKDRVDRYNRDLVQLCLDAKNDRSEQARARHEQQLLDIFAEAVEDLDEDRVSQDGFDLFAFSWQAAYSLIHGVPARGVRHSGRPPEDTAPVQPGEEPA